MLRLLTCLAFLAALTLPTTGQEPAPGWGHLKGQVVFGGDKLPVVKAINVTTDKKECLAKGPIVSEEYVLDKETRGVRWVFVALVDPKDPKAALPVHPMVQKNLPKKVSLDTPCCVIEPHVLGM